MCCHWKTNKILLNNKKTSNFIATYIFFHINVQFLYIAVFFQWIKIYQKIWIQIHQNFSNKKKNYKKREIFKNSQKYDQKMRKLELSFYLHILKIAWWKFLRIFYIYKHFKNILKTFLKAYKSFKNIYQWNPEYISKNFNNTYYKIIPFPKCSKSDEQFQKHFKKSLI